MPIASTEISAHKRHSAHCWFSAIAARIADFGCKRKKRSGPRGYPYWPATDEVNAAKAAQAVLEYFTILAYVEGSNGMV